MRKTDLMAFLNTYKDEVEVKILTLDYDGDYHSMDICGIEITNGCIYLKDHTNVNEG